MSMRCRRHRRLRWGSSRSRPRFGGFAHSSLTRRRWHEADQARMRILTVVGARPQFIKAAIVSRALREAGIDELLVHTGQHYDDRLSDIFFRELGLAAPHVHLGIGSGSHGEQTGHMVVELEKVIDRERPDRVLIFGDTNS